MRVTPSLSPRVRSNYLRQQMSLMVLIVGGRVEDRQQVKTALYRDFHTGNRYGRGEAAQWQARIGLVLHLCIGRLEPVDPLAVLWLVTAR